MNLHDIRASIPTLRRGGYYNFQVQHATHTGARPGLGGATVTGYILNRERQRISDLVTIDVPFWDQEAIEYINAQTRTRRDGYTFPTVGADYDRWNLR